MWKGPRAGSRNVRGGRSGLGHRGRGGAHGVCPPRYAPGAPVGGRRSAIEESRLGRFVARGTTSASPRPCFGAQFTSGITNAPAAVPTWRPCALAESSSEGTAIGLRAVPVVDPGAKALDAVGRPRPRRQQTIDADDRVLVCADNERRALPLFRRRERRDSNPRPQARSHLSGCNRWKHGFNRDSISDVCTDDRCLSTALITLPACIRR
jgi:hypothetical protein